MNRERPDPTRYFTAEEVARARSYQRPLEHAQAISTLATLAVMVAVIWTDAAARLIDATGVDGWVLQVLVVIGALAIAMELVTLPVSIWKTLVHEGRWGFNTRTPGGFVADQVKEMIVFGFVVMSLLLVPVWALLRATDLWWLWGGLTMVATTATLGALYPVVLLPVFNKLLPLEDRELADRLRALAERVRLRIGEISVMDASKRSRKDNAFFAGMGATRRVVLYDTLLTMPHESIEAIVGHELGHWKLGHLRKNALLGILRFPIVLALIAAITSWEPARDWAGVERLGDPASLPFFLLVAGFVFTVMGWAVAWQARRDERAADRFAFEQAGDARPLAAALRATADRNLADLDPSWWKRLRETHPSIVERLADADAWTAQRA